MNQVERPQSVIGREIASQKARLAAMGITTMDAMIARMAEPEVKGLYENLKWLRAEESGVCIGWDPD